MSTVSPQQWNFNDAITAAKLNTPINQIAAVVNGNLDDTNITSLSGSKITAATLPPSASTTAGNVETRFTDSFFDHVASGCVWTGDAYASTRNASMTAGVVYISGKRIVVSAVTAHTFTASKDTYVDIDSTGTVTYAESTNNTASQALAAGSIRVAIIVTGASNIAAAGSVNQGQETMVLPIVSSVPFAVTDSLGNLICPRDPNRKTLGYRRITSNYTLSSSQTTPTQVTGLSVPVIVPTGRKVKISTYGFNLTNATTSNTCNIFIYDGAVGGTEINQSSVTATLNPAYVEDINTPSVTSKTYNTAISSSGATNVTLGAASVAPAWIKVELA